MNRSISKRLLAVVLAAVMLVAMNASAAAVWAAELQKPEMPSASTTKVNPMYAHLDLPVSNGIATASEVAAYEAADAQEAAAIMKELLVSRAEAATIRMPVDIPFDEEDEDAFFDELWALEEEIFLDAVAHTGDPEEGDYLRYNFYARPLYVSTLSLDPVVVELQYNFIYHATAEQEQAVDDAVAALLNSWKLSGADDYEKVRAAYDWLCENVVYSETISDEYSTIYSAYGALVEKDCVCQGYAAALYRLLLEMDVDCRVITGIGNGGPHAWNIIEMEEQYYNADATWDATYLQAGWEYQFFLRSEENFTDHYRDSEFDTETFHAAYPMGSADYVYVPSVEEPVTSGACGETATWNFADGVLTISGTGVVTENPWLEDYADSIVSAVIEDGITYLCDSAFDGCGNLTAVSIGNTVQTLGYYAFRNCTALESVSIPGSVLRIGHSAFAGCTALTQVALTEGLEFVELYAFSGCGLTSVVIPASVTDLGVEAFGDCAALQSVQFLGDAPEFDVDVFKNVTATVSIPAQNDTWTEEVMQPYGGNLTWPVVEKLFTLEGVTISLWDSLDMYFVMAAENVEEGCYAVCTRSYADGRADHAVTVPYDQWLDLYGNLKAAAYTGIAAKEMGDEITIVVYDAQGNAISEAWTESVESYALRMLQNEEILADGEAMTMFVDMLNYGAAAQIQFGYDKANLVNADLTEEQKACATASYTTQNHLVGSPGRAGTALTLKNQITLDIIFKNSVIGSDYSSLYAIASYTDHYGEAVEIQISGSQFKAYGKDCGYVSIPGLAIADYGQTVTCTVYDADGNVLAWATDSIEGYAHRMAGKLPEIVGAIIKFGISAYHYFH